MSDTPIYSDLEVVHDTGRSSFEDAPETGGEDTFRRSFGDESRNRSAGAFGRAPEAQRAEIVNAEPLSPDDALEVLGESFALREQLEQTAYALEDANEERLDQAAYFTEYDDRDELAEAADTLLNAGGGQRLEALLWRWEEQDAPGAQAWVESREAYMAQQAAAADVQDARTAQQQTEAQYAAVLNEFQAAHPETRAGGLMHEMVADVLARHPGTWASPGSFKQALNEAYEVSADVANGAVSAASELDFRAAFRQESLRHGAMRPPSQEHLASFRPIGPGSPGEFAAEINARAKGTAAQRQAALQQRDAEFRHSFAQASRGSGFGEGAREQVASALKAREQERAGRRPPNRGV